jgi:hypothetical protein
MIIFYGEELLDPRPTPKLEDHPLSAVRDVSFAYQNNMIISCFLLAYPFLFTLGPERSHTNYFFCGLGNKH